MEREKGCAVCDTDPLKLHYSWCLYQIDALPKRQWELQLQATRIALLEKRLGFADAYFVKVIDPLIAKQQLRGRHFSLAGPFRSARSVTTIPHPVVRAIGRGCRRPCAVARRWAADRCYFGQRPPLRHQRIRSLRFFIGDKSRVVPLCT